MPGIDDVPRLPDTPAEFKLTRRCTGMCLIHCHDDILQGIIAQAVREAVAEEREACARLAEEHDARYQVDEHCDACGFTAPLYRRFADLIRARSEP